MSLINNIKSTSDKYGTKALIDTLAIAKMLKKAGFSDEQAEAQAEVISYTVSNSVINTTVTKVELLEVKQELKDEIHLVRIELKEEINQVRTELKEEINQVRIELKDGINQIRTEIKDEINHVRTELNIIEKKILYMLGGSFIALLTILITFIQFKFG